MQLNPFAKVETIRGSAGEIDGLRIVAPVKRRGLQTTLILRAEDAGAFVARRRTVLSALLDAQSGRDPWPALSSAERDALERSGLFLGDAEMPREVVFAERPLPVFDVDPDTLTIASAQMRDCGVAVIASVVGGSALDDMRRYYRALVDEGFTQYGGEGGEARRWVLHNDALSRTLHPSLVASISAIAGVRLKPSFSYVLVYLEGATLERHTDRPQCAVTAVLQLDFDPEPEGATPWRLCFQRGHAQTSRVLGLGDLVVFRGTEIEHYREPFACGRSSTSLAFCFVPEDFAGSLD